MIFAARIISCITYGKIPSPQKLQKEQKPPHPQPSQPQPPLRIEAQSKTTTNAAWCWQSILSQSWNNETSFVLGISYWLSLLSWICSLNYIEEQGLFSHSKAPLFFKSIRKKKNIRYIYVKMLWCFYFF